MGFLDLFRTRRGTTAPATRGRTMRQQVDTATVPLFGAEPFGLGLATLLARGYRTGAGMSGGREAANFNTGAGITGRDARRTPALQEFARGTKPVTIPRTSALGAQSGPSQMPAFPSTGGNGTPTVSDALAGMSLPALLPSAPAVRR